METIIVLLLILLIFKDEIIELKTAIKAKKKPEEEPNKRKEEFEKELNNIMDYSINKAIESKKRGEADE